jgi:hypothetical protein
LEYSRAAPAALPRGARTVLTLALASEAGPAFPAPAPGAPPPVLARGSAGLTVEPLGWDGERLTLAVTPAASAAATESLRLATADVELATVTLSVADAAAPPRRAPRLGLELGGFAGLLIPPSGSELGQPRAVRDQLASGPMFGARLAVRALSRPWLAGRLELGGAALSQVGTPDLATFYLPAAAVAVRPLHAGDLELWTFAGAGLARLASAPGSIQAEAALSLEGGAGVLVRHAGLAFRLDAVYSLLDPGGVAELWPSVRVGLSRAFER